MTELLKCPFCGGSTFERRDDVRCSILCETCLAEGPLAQTMDVAEQLWNTRAVPDLSTENARLRADLADQLPMRDADAFLIDRLRKALEVPEVWSDEERDGMATAFIDGMATVFIEAGGRHGHYETMFATAAWLLRHRARAALNPDTKEGG